MASHFAAVGIGILFSREIQYLSYSLAEKLKCRDKRRSRLPVIAVDIRNARRKF